MGTVNDVDASDERGGDCGDDDRSSYVDGQDEAMVREADFRTGGGDYLRRFMRIIHFVSACVVGGLFYRVGVDGVGHYGGARGQVEDGERFDHPDVHPCDDPLFPFVCVVDIVGCQFGRIRHHRVVGDLVLDEGQRQVHQIGSRRIA